MVNLDKHKTMKRIKITQVRSGIGHTLRQKRTLEALGLKKMHHSVELDATPQILGMCKKIEHLVKVEEV
jgi:large subunit ribosomal protein L30